MKSIVIIVAVLVVVGLVGVGAYEILETPPAALPEGEHAPDLLTGNADTDDAGPTLTGTGEEGESTDDNAPIQGKATSTTGTPLGAPPGQSARSRYAGKPTPPDTFEVMLLQDGRPFPGEARGLAWRVGTVSSAGAIPAGKPPTEFTDMAGGLVRFEGLTPGRSKWMFGIQLDDGVQRLFYSTHTAGLAPNPRQLLELGTGTVFGSVYDANGDPATNAVVRVGPQASSGFIVDVTPDASGRYRIEHLTPGPAWVSIALQGDLDDDKQGTNRQIVIPDKGEIEASFGTPAGDPLIAGVVRCLDGEGVRGPGRVILSHADPDGFIIVKYDKHGRFSQRVPARSYTVYVWRPSGSGLNGARDPFVVRHDDEEVTFRMPDTRVQGTVRLSTGKPLPKGDKYVGVWGTKRGSRPVYGRVADDGAFVVYALAPGRYNVRLTMSGYEARAEIEVDEGDVVVRQNLVATRLSNEKIAAQHR